MIIMNDTMVQWDDGETVPYAEAANFSKDMQLQPELIVIHYTAGRGYTSTVNHFQRRTTKASAHFVIARHPDMEADRGVTQMVPLSRPAWHAGTSSWNHRLHVNRFSIGIELDNYGRLGPAGGDGRRSTWFQRPVLAVDSLVTGTGSAWHTYTEAQIEACYELCEALIDRFPSIADVVGHQDVSPGRKQDPGPAFPMAELRDMLFGRADK